MVDPLPSLGATTAVPGAAGLSPRVLGSGQIMPGDPDYDPNFSGPQLRIVGGSNTPEPSVENNPFSDTFKRLWGVEPIFEKSAIDRAKDAPSDPNGADGEEVIPGPVPISGNLDDLLKWLQENVPLLIVVGLVVLLGVYGVSAATGR